MKPVIGRLGWGGGEHISCCTVFAPDGGFGIWAAESPGNNLNLGGEEYRGREIDLDLTLEAKTEKKWTRKKWPKPFLPHPCSIFDIADLEYSKSANFIRSGWISAFQSCQNFRNRPIVAKTVHLFVRTVGFGVATTPSHSYPDNRLHITNLRWRRHAAVGSKSQNP